jgi:hypothetical protein
MNRKPPRNSFQTEDSAEGSGVTETSESKSQHWDSASYRTERLNRALFSRQEITRRSGGTLENAQQMANHSSPRTTKLNDRRNDETSLDEYKPIGI